METGGCEAEIFGHFRSMRSLVLKPREKFRFVHDSSVGSKMEALPSKIFSSDTFMAGVGLLKKKTRINTLKEPLSHVAALEKTITS